MELADDLAPAGTGLRAKQLSMFEPSIARVFQRLHSEECEERVQAAGINSGIRLAKGIPPYLKWAIWRARPKRPKDAPRSYDDLKKRLGMQGGICSYSVPVRSFNLMNIPRMIGQATYICGEVGMNDRRVVVTMTEVASERGRQSDRGNFVIRSPEILDRLGVSKTSNKAREEIPATLWRLGGTAIRLATGDPLSGSWGTRSFFLLPMVDVIKDGRQYIVEYDFPAPASALIDQGKLCTVDLHRARVMTSPAAESLYFLLYDIAQWSNKTSMEYSVVELAERVGISVQTYSKGSKDYARWKRIVGTLQRASDEVYRLAQFLVDYDVRGFGASASFVFYFTDGPFRKGHLPHAITTP